MTVRISHSKAGPSGYDPPPLLDTKKNDSERLRCAVKSLSNSAAMLSLAGEIDMSTANRLIHCFQLLADKESTGVVIDATGVTFMDSSGLHALIEGRRLMHDLNCRIVLVPSRQMRKLLELVFPEPLFAAQVDSIEEGLSALNPDNWIRMEVIDQATGHPWCHWSPRGSLS